MTGDRSAPRIRIALLGWSLAAFLALSYTICAIFAALFSWDRMFEVWIPLLPWVEGLTPGGFVLGLVETIAWGWFIAVGFGAIHNFLAERMKA